MAEEWTEICGFLDVKYLGSKCKTHKVKKRALTSWKVWRRHWCSIKKLGLGMGVKVQIECGGTPSPSEKDNSIIIPLNAVICRTQSRSKQFAFGIFQPQERKPLLYLAGNSETESQRWMANIRQLLRPRKHRFLSGAHVISMVDNPHSKASGLTGLYGDLVSSTVGLFIKDAHSGEIVETFDWKELDQFHLTTAGRPEDVKCICVIHTTKEFRGGVGELHVFCLDAASLLQDLVTQGRGPRNRHSDRRPLSLSEGDLRVATCEEVLRNYPILSSKVAGNFVDAGMGLFIPFRAEPRLWDKSTGKNSAFDRSSSKSTDAGSENHYQPEPNSIPNDKSITVVADDAARRRISDMSTASGIYEEIEDNAEEARKIAIASKFYANRLVFGHQPEPPPLPPRQRCASMSASTTRTATPVSAGGFAFSTINRAAIPPDDCMYVPMSPQLKDVTMQQLRAQTSMQENDYVIMR